MNTRYPKRVALIGIGDIAHKVYLPLLSHHKRAEIVGIMSRSAATVEETMNSYRILQGTTELSTLLSWDLDAVFVHSPTETHYEIVMACLRHGLSVYVDKPLSYDLKEAEEMANFAKSKGLLLAVGFNRRFAPMYTEAKTWMDEVGGYEQCVASKHRTRIQSTSSRVTVYDDLIHMLDTLLWLGDDQAYQLLQHHLLCNEEGHMRHASGVLGLGKGKTSSYSMVRTAGSDLEKLELHGHGRSVEIVNMENGLFYQKEDAPTTRSFGSWDTILHRRGFSDIVNHFLEHIDSPDDCTVSADKVLGSHVLASELV
ncbi:virulence factor [Paenibacillus sp. DS2015]|uniref:Gfo/Idh/MocA family protein n=1 Tax=Paenibacillus sp. DS2015 TaxID=3373917 RepID=UPI003D249DDF